MLIEPPGDEEGIDDGRPLPQLALMLMNHLVMKKALMMVAPSPGWL